MRRAALFCALAIAIVSCKSAPAEIPENLSQAEIIQLAQESADSENWDAATAYYEAVLARYPQDRASVVTAQYEIAFIHYKQDELELARAGLEQVLGLYDFEADVLPQWPMVLAQRLLDEIPSDSVTEETDSEGAAAQ
jgi:outer membrane protein assembly factor BamD (BamD/ComL family)